MTQLLENAHTLDVEINTSRSQGISNAIAYAKFEEVSLIRQIVISPKNLRELVNLQH